MDRNNQEIVPKPANRMDKIRRSLSFRRKKKQPSKKDPPLTTTPPSSSSTPPQASSTNNTANNKTNEATSTTSTVNKPPLWIEDEKKVRAGNCSFQVKVNNKIKSIEIYIEIKNY